MNSLSSESSETHSSPISPKSCSAGSTALVGDRLYTDIAVAQNAGAVSVLVLSGETTQEMYDTIECVEEHMPKDKPRYLMGVGTPSNIIESVARGVDFFDCVMPARNGRHGHMFTMNGIVNIKNEKYADDDLLVSSINPYELYLIMNEIVDGQNDPRIADATNKIMFMIDQNHVIEDKMITVVKSVIRVQTAYAKALLIDRKALLEAREITKSGEAQLRR